MNDDKRVYFSDFVTAVVCRKMEAGDEVLLKATFDRFDIDNSGYISMQNMKNLFGDEYKRTSVEEMMHEVDLDGNELIDFEEFKNYLVAKSRKNLMGGGAPHAEEARGERVVDDDE